MPTRVRNLELATTLPENTKSGQINKLSSSYSSTRKKVKISWDCQKITNLYDWRFVYYKDRF